MFYSCKISSIEFPKNLKHIGDYVFYKVIFDNLDFVIPDSVNSYGRAAFVKTNLRSLIGNNVISVYASII